MARGTQRNGANAVDMQGLAIATDGPLYTKGAINALAEGATLPLVLASDSIHIWSSNFSDSAYASGQTPPGMPRSWNVSVSNWELVTGGDFIAAGGADLKWGGKNDSLENEGE